jgi:cell division initiation protein
MDLTPNDVEQKAFTQALRGYQMDEVDDFLDEIVTTLRSYDQRLRDAQDKIRALETDAVNRGGDETTISRAILVAQRSADALLAEARVDAERIKHTAIAETESLSAERDVERNRLMADIEGMRNRVSGLRDAVTVLASVVGGQVSEMEAEIADAATQLRPEGQEEPETTDQPLADVFSSENDPTPIFQVDEMEPADLEDPDAQAQDQPHDIDLSGPGDDDDDFSDEEVASRVSARPWERG